MPDVSIAHLLTHSLVLERKERMSNGKGGFVEDYLPVGSMVGRVNPASNRELEIAHQKQAEVTHYIYLAADSDIKVNDRILFEGRSFRVTIPNADTPSIPIYQKVYVVELQRG